jgi:hypothetical protein
MKNFMCRAYLTPTATLVPSTPLLDVAIGSDTLRVELLEHPDRSREIMIDWPEDPTSIPLGQPGSLGLLSSITTALQAVAGDMRDICWDLSPGTASKRPVTARAQEPDRPGLPTPQVRTAGPESTRLWPVLADRSGDWQHHPGRSARSHPGGRGRTLGEDVTA